MKSSFKKNILTSPGKIISGSLAIIILVGAFLLWLPGSHCGPLSFLDALFTATSATCVTGLLIVPLSSFTFSGQCIILLLMQIGGIGLVTLTIFLISLFFELKLSTRILTEKMLEIESWEVSYHLLLFIVCMTLIVELFGAACVFFTIKDSFPWGQALFFSIFQSVSAFTTAGLSFFENEQGVMPANLTLMGITALLVFIGGLGFIVWEEILAHIVSWREKKHVNWSLHTKLVLYMTLVIIAFTTLMFFYLEAVRPGFDGSWTGTFTNALFNAITCRSSGFTTLYIPTIHLATLFLVMIVSFIGSSPGSTGSGIKTTTFALFLAAIKATILHRSSVEIRGRTIPNEQIFKAMAVLSLSLTWIAVTVFFLLITEQGWRFIDIMFEAFSAFSNLGLSTGITPYLSVTGKYIIIATMFIGRIGSLTLLLAFQSSKEKKEYHYPEERVVIG